ncbi:MAG: membrane protein insertase YidC, partial [Saprospiraceae bacterium]|nr:membrane protein insertase YidC [Saprospiraceae bacterium]
MERNHIIGFALIFAVLFVWSEFFFKPNMEKKAKEKKFADSIALASQPQPSGDTSKFMQAPVAQNSGTILDTTSKDSLIQEQTFVLKNKLVEISISNKGAKIIKAKIDNYKKISPGKNNEEIVSDLFLLEDPKNKFDYQIQTAQGPVNTGLLVFESTNKTDESVELKANLPGGGTFFVSYHLKPEDYVLDYSIRVDHAGASNDVVLQWENYLDKLEKNYEYEKFYTSVYYKEKEEDADYCSCRSDDKHDSKTKSVEWVSHSNQFFNSSLIPKEGFSSGSFETVMLAENSEDLKLLKSTLNIPAASVHGKNFDMQWYLGPNEYKRLSQFKNHLQDIIPYGWSIFGTINRHMIRPLFSFLNDFMGSKGLIILLMTLIVKLLVFPLAYKMLKSQARMTALKPEIDKVKAKHKDDLQQQQVETMKMYNEFGVNPLGGCFPLLLQMPIWIALYRFFPATIDFRQASFLWASDLSSFDEFLILPFSIPFFGNTLSLFAFLWVISTLVFTYFSSKTMDFSANPAMLYMQYLMPLMFWFMFNKTAAGLTCYMFFSNLLN